MDYRVGDEVRVLRDLPSSIRAGDKGIVRGKSAAAQGLRYAIRFDCGMRVVRSTDLAGGSVPEDSSPHAAL